MALTWKDVLAAGAADARIAAYRELLEKALEEDPGVEKYLNLAIRANEEAYGQAFVAPTLAKLAEEVGELDEGTAVGAFFYALPVYVEFPEISPFAEL